MVEKKQDYRKSQKHGKLEENAEAEEESMWHWFCPEPHRNNGQKRRMCGGGRRGGMGEWVGVHALTRMRLMRDLGRMISTPSPESLTDTILMTKDSPMRCTHTMWSWGFTSPTLAAITTTSSSRVSPAMQPFGNLLHCTHAKAAAAAAAAVAAATCVAPMRSCCIAAE